MLTTSATKLIKNTRLSLWSFSSAPTRFTVPYSHVSYDRSERECARCAYPATAAAGQVYRG